MTVINNIYGQQTILVDVDCSTSSLLLILLMAIVRVGN